MMHNYAWTLIIWWKRNIFIYFIRCYWIKNLLLIVIQNKNIYLFHKHEINNLHVYYLISYVIFGLFIFFLSLCKIEYFGTAVNISFNTFWNFLSIFAFFKSLKNLVMFFIFSLKDIDEKHWTIQDYTFR